jgi:hypothetical protein
MKFERQVCSLELAKKLKELGVRQEGIHTWQRRRHDKQYELDPGGSFETADDDAWFSAFTVAELGEMLPASVVSGKTEFDAARLGRWVAAQTEGSSGYFHGDGEYANTEADARAKMLIHLLENGILKVDNINQSPTL